MLLSLGIICVVSAVLLGYANNATRPAIAKSKRDKLENAIREVVSGFDNSPLDEMYEVALTDKDKALVYPAKKGGLLIGIAVETTSFNGFSGEIRILTGLDTNGTILNYAVLAHAETPGLGDKMAFWFKTDKKDQNIIGRMISGRTLRLKKDGGDIDGITASTISSRAFLEAVNKSYSAYSGNQDANSAATPSSDANSGATALSADDGASEADGQSEATSKAEEDAETPESEPEEKK